MKLFIAEPGVERLKILIVSAEVAPFAKVGGLADVAGALPKALARMGHDVKVILPLYKMIETDPRWNLKVIGDDFDVHVNPNWVKRSHLKEVVHEGVTFQFVGTDDWFVHSVDSQSLYQPGGDHHLYFSCAVLKAMEHQNWIPDVVHGNDWHVGLLPVIMREKSGSHWDKVASVYTIHNFAYQGEFGTEVLDKLDLPYHLYNSDQLETWGNVNFMKSGMVFADRVNTVSETYAREIQTPEFGCALEGLTQHLSKRGMLWGVLNGIDMDTFDPSTDVDLPANFSAADLAGKAVCRAELMKEIGLEPIEGAPLFGIVSRMSRQKGLDLIMEAAPELFKLPIQLVIQGLGEPLIMEGLRELERQYPKHFRFLERFDAPLAQRVYAGSDAFLMPSKFEPCGLGQLIAMRYGTVPVVRATGGLADTVHDAQNGFSFKEPTAVQLLATVKRCLKTWKKPEEWHKLQLHGMHGDYGWHGPAKRYEAMYNEAISSRQTSEAMSA